jgi:DNA-directed RNA polymerase sigma subunit (sigma70/sigma32)
MESEQNLNCTLLAAKKYDQGMILEDIGKIFNVTRMRVCQIEKSTLNKLNSSS